MKYAISAAIVSLCLVLTGYVLAQDADVVAGKRQFRSREGSATGMTCWHCHADFNEKKTPDQYVRPGHPMFNAGFRAQFQAWDGKPLRSLEAAISTCMERWITERKDGSLSGEAAPAHRVRQLAAYLQTEDLSPERKSKAVEPMRAEAVPGDRMLTMGDSSLGSVVFRRSCEICHIHDGKGPAPSLIRNGFSRYQIGKKIRGLDNKGLRGIAMPPFSKDRLSDREMLNVVAFVYQL
jgi:cytochrome c553